MLQHKDHPIDNGTRATGGALDWIDYRLPIFTFLRRELNEYPTARNLTYLWNFGSLSGIVLLIMIVTGIVLAMHYTPTTAGAFDSVEHIMRDVNYGWLIRFLVILPLVGRLERPRPLPTSINRPALSLPQAPVSTATMLARRK